MFARRTRWFGRFICSAGRRCPAFVPRFHFCSRVGALSALPSAIYGGHKQFFDTGAGTRAVFDCGPCALTLHSDTTTALPHRQLTPLSFPAWTACLSQHVVSVFLSSLSVHYG